MSKPKSPCILYMSSFPPRECGIATFTQDLTNSIDKEFNPEIKSKILAINENGTSIYNYPRKVIKQLGENDMEDYINRANEINKSPDIKLVNIQHEYGLFGGEWGDYLLPFMELLNKPVIVTMHTVLPRPSEKLKKITKVVTEKAHAVVVMTKTSARMLEKTYGVKSSKINIIPHGVHHIPFPSKARAKRKLNLNGYTVLSTFGMLNRDKGIEYAIEALPDIVAEHPDVLYLVIGATHPNIRKHEGEVYRNKLKRIVKRHKLEDNVKFYDKYLDLSELIDYLKATDIYISPTLNPKQAVSGTISYALSCACPVVATANQYAKDVIGHERGMLTRFENSDDIQKALEELLADKRARKEMGKNAYFYSRHMTWQNVALNYFTLFNKFAKIVPRRREKFPPVKLDYLKNLTDDFGMIQFANHTKPDIYSGYCLDDNARALIGCVRYYEKKRRKPTLNLIEKYLDFIQFTQKQDGKFHNFVSHNRVFNDRTESEDSFGRAVWALAVTISSYELPEHIEKQARRMFKKTIKHVSDLHSLRAIAFTIVGLSLVTERDNDEELTRLVQGLADKLVNTYRQQTDNSRTKDWLWFENCFTYSNYKLPEALFRAYSLTEDRKYLQIATESLKFLIEVTFENKDYFSPIGQDGWYFRNGKRAYFDQQPEDTASAVEGLALAYRITRREMFRQKAELAFQWFLGKNHLNQMVYDEATGGCYDGLGKYSLNFNQGAESTVSYFQARLVIESIYK